jgi:type I restriction enzyme S subunit
MRAKGIVEGFWRLYTDDFYNIRLPVPPSSEREDIAAHFGEETKPVQESALRAEREIGLLYEYRTRLIADVVTGKLDVRQAAAGLPEEMEIHDELDEIIAEDEADVFSLVDTEAELDVA